MEDDLEKIIDSLVVPEMEYVKTKRGAEKTVDVPEVVLPKTRAEEYQEAKGRLGQKTAATPRTTDKPRAPRERTITRERRRAIKTAERVVPEVVLPEVAAAMAEAVADVPQTAEEKKQRTIERISGLRRKIDAPKWVGDGNDIVPFAWRFPLVEVAKPSRLYKMTMREARERAMLLPAPRQ